MRSIQTTRRLAGALMVAALATYLGYARSSSVAEPATRQGRAATGEPATDKHSERSRNLYAVLFEMSTGFTPGGEILGMAEHATFVKTANADGIVPIAGPIFGDEQKNKLVGALYLIRATSLDEARSIAQKEPLVHHKTIKIASIWPFIAGVGADRLE